MQKAIDHIAAVYIAEGLTEAVICPGSRNAPLTIAFVRSGKINCLSVADERSAGFIALGKARALNKPVALICTSGSAVANFYPAILEAYYQKVSLIIITADRPPELIDQWDGQTIRQPEIFGSHVRGFWQMPDHYDNPLPFAKITQAAIHKSIYPFFGPVHINVPLREPFYPSPEHRFEAEWPESVTIHQELEAENFDIRKLKGKKVLLLRGMRNGPIQPAPQGWAAYEDILCGILFNLASVSELIFMNQSASYLKSLKPDIILSDGTAIISKTIKQFLSKYPPTVHYHFSPEGEIADPFNTHPKLVRESLDELFPKLAKMVIPDYGPFLLTESVRCRLKQEVLLATSHWNEFNAIQTCIHHLPESSVIHAANSMAIRYVAYCEPQKKGHPVYANRGTSGIDGCVSTALGFMSVHKGLNYLFVGDVAFFYDSNAFWNALGSLPLKVILINNGGGGIFRMIEGPASQPERLEFFESAHKRDAEYLCKNLGVSYFCARNEAELLKGMFHLNQCETAAVLEVFSDPEDNQTFFNQYKSTFHGV